MTFNHGVGVPDGSPNCSPKQKSNGSMKKHLTIKMEAVKINNASCSERRKIAIGQVVKTSPFHGGNRGSESLWVTNTAR